MTVSIDYAAYIGAITAQGKNDVRFYLNGFFIDPKGFLVATDGHRMFCAEIAPGVGPHIVAMKGKGPTRFDHVVLKFESKTAEFIDKFGNSMMVLPFELLDGRYPDWQRAAAYRQGKEAVEGIGFDLSYMTDAAKIAKAYGKPYARFEFHAAHGPIRIYFNGGNAWMSVMPCRI